MKRFIDFLIFNFKIYKFFGIFELFLDLAGKIIDYMGQ
jgi:hypothetical protein